MGGINNCQPNNPGTSAVVIGALGVALNYQYGAKGNGYASRLDALQGTEDDGQPVVMYSGAVSWREL